MAKIRFNKAVTFTPDPIPQPEAKEVKFIDPQQIDYNLSTGANRVDVLTVFADNDGTNESFTIKRDQMIDVMARRMDKNPQGIINFLTAYDDALRVLIARKAGVDESDIDQDASRA